MVNFGNLLSGNCNQVSHWNCEYPNLLPAGDFKKESPSIAVKVLRALSLSYSTGSESGFLNFDAQSLRPGFENSGISYFMLPALRCFHFNVNENTNLYQAVGSISPALSTILQPFYKKTDVVLPMSYLININVWKTSVGIGYKL